MARNEYLHPSPIQPRYNLDAAETLRERQTGFWTRLTGEQAIEFQLMIMSRVRDYERMGTSDYAYLGLQGLRNLLFSLGLRDSEIDFLMADKETRSKGVTL